MSDAYEQIRRNHLQKHSHDNSNDNRCSQCGSFISIPSDAEGQTRIQCNACGAWQLKYLPKTQPAMSD